MGGSVCFIGRMYREELGYGRGDVSSNYRGDASSNPAAIIV
jgi:hypothetical protein